MLDQRFPAVTYLGDTGMDLDRAIRTVPAVMDSSWRMGEWTRHEATATTTHGRSE